MGRTLDDLFPDGGPVLLDGATGSCLRQQGWPATAPTIMANLEAPELVERVHRSHRDAGAQVLSTNTFSALMLDDGRCRKAVKLGANLARRAAGPKVKVAGTVAAFGLAVEDGQLREVVATLADQGVDLLVFETCNKLRDAVQALILRDEVAPHLPAVICVSTTDGGKADRDRVRTIIDFVHAAGDPQVDVGLNCCRGPHDALRVALSTRPVLRWVKPSTGLPGDQVDAHVMAAFARAAHLNQVRFIGGCCGTTPETLAEMGRALGEPVPAGPGEDEPGAAVG
jgi:homocysteine S-methyltransferase